MKLRADFTASECPSAGQQKGRARSQNLQEQEEHRDAVQGAEAPARGSPGGTGSKVPRRTRTPVRRSGARRRGALELLAGSSGIALGALLQLLHQGRPVQPQDFRRLILVAPGALERLV